VIYSSKDAATAAEDWILFGVFGYANIDAHMKWKETKEHGQIMEVFGKYKQEYGLHEADLLGKNMFHVHFQAGA
jgi:hypothetical protein